MASVNFSGLASGLDTRAIVDAILNAERQPLERLQQRQQLFDQQKAAYDQLRSKLSSFEGALRNLSSARTFRGRSATVSDESVLRATTSSGAEVGLFEIRIDALASAHKTKSDGFAAADQGLLSDGTITIQSGDDDPIEIEVRAADGNNDLQSVRDAINAADAGVAASVLFDGSNYRLVVRATETGTANALSITDGTNLGLDDPLNEIAAAADALLYVDGLEITSSTNKITGVIPGVTLDLLRTTPEDDLGNPLPETLEIAQDTDGVVSAVQTLVAQYNDLVNFFNAQFDRDNPGPLRGESTARQIQSRLQTLFTGGATGIPFGGIRSLSSIGVSFDGKTGEAALDPGELRELLDTRFEEVGNLFVSSGTPTDGRIRFVSGSTATASGEYGVQITQAAERASVLGGAAIVQLASDETLTITVGGTEVQVLLAQDDELSDVVDKINAAFDGAEVGAFAAADGGRLRLSTDAYGSAASLSVVSDRAASGDGSSTEIGVASLDDSGLDVAGSIGGVEATGNGQLLSAAATGDVSGVVLRAQVTAADVTSTGGDFGSLFYTRGLISDILVDTSRFTRVGDGPIALAREGLESRSGDIDLDIERIEARLASRETRLLRTFAEAERAISALQSQQSSLGGIFGL